MKFIDTNGLLVLQNRLLDEQFVISSKSLEELEHIKVSANKDQDIKYKARQVVRLLEENEGKYQVVIPDNETFEIIKDFQLEINPDNIIMACAYQYSQNNDIIFYTNDICCKLIARNRFGLRVGEIKNKTCNYKGYTEKTMLDEEMNYFYSHLKENIYELLDNEYLVIKNNKGEIVDTYRWNGESHISLYKKNIKSLSFGDKIKPKDIYQSMVIDSIMNNTITTISGKAGSGKSLLSLVCAMNLIESGKYDSLVVMFNPTKAKGSIDLGFYSGNFIEKAMQNSIGNILSTKFGDRYQVDLLIQQEKIKLVSVADCRGMEIKDNEILYMTECQNTSIELLKLCLSRASAESKIIIEGDFNMQVDSYLFDGDKNGMRRVVDVLKGSDVFGYVELKNVWRSKIAELVDKM